MISKFDPTVFGVQLSMMAPCGTIVAPKRITGFADVSARSVDAGTIASSSGNASVAPIPRKNVRRGNAILVMYMQVS